MANRVKEDEKNERIIRGLLKLRENRRCINCNSLVRFFCFCFLNFLVASFSYTGVLILIFILFVSNYGLVEERDVLL